MKEGVGAYSSPRWSSEVLDCSMPMSFDTYNTCAFQCSYCFAFFQRAVSSNDYLLHNVRSVDVRRIKRLFLNPDGAGEQGKQFGWYIKAKHVLQWGGLSDGFDWYERKLRKSLELLRFFREIEYPISISSKSAWILDDPEYVEALTGSGHHVHWKTSIICMDTAQAKALEKGVAPPVERFEFMRKLADMGIPVTLRFRPYMIGVADKDGCDIAMLDMAKEVGCQNVTTEFLCLDKRSIHVAHERWKPLSAIAGFDVPAFYKKHSASAGGLMRLNYDIKRPHVERMVEHCDKIGLDFFISDAHHREKSCHSGCCGLPKGDKGLGKGFKGHFAEAIVIAREKGVVHWSDISLLAAPLKAVPFTRALGFNNQGTVGRKKFFHQSLFDYMHYVWNDTQSWSSPARYFGGTLVADGKDEHGDVVYLYNRAYIEKADRTQSLQQIRKQAVPS